jgi:2-methylcitrate synthase
MDGTMTDYDKFVAKKGLEGIVFDTSSVSNVIAQEKSLYYRGYPVQDLAENCSFEETAYLLINGELPNATQLADFEASERAARELSPSLLEVIERFPRKGHPMDSIRTVVSYLGMEPEFAGDEFPESARKKGTMLLAKIPTAIAAFQRIRHGKPPIAPTKDLSIAANFFHMCFGEVPDPAIVKAFDGSLTMYAEHSFNASTFTARVVVSTLADLCGAITAAIATLKGPLHGGANEEVMYMLQEIGTADKAQAWLDERLAKKEKIMGFGHRVYRLGDSRVPTMSKFRDQMAELKGGQKWVEISNILETGMREKKNIYPNLDFPAGPAYFLMGFEIDMFTPIFVMARTAGWVAHVVEQLADNRLVRPLADYIGPKPRQSKPIAERS